MYTSLTKNQFQNLVMIEYEIKPQSKFSLGLKELWKYRELFYFFTWRDVKVKYKQAALGILWAILQPLIMMLMFTLIFSKALNVGSDGIPYPVFAISGLLIWNIFSSGLLNSANSMITNANIIKKIYFPMIPMLWPGYTSKLTSFKARKVLAFVFFLNGLAIASLNAR